jgi:hypothetical protein
MKRKVLCCFIIACMVACCDAQQTFSTAGGEVSGTRGTLSYTIGQVVYTTNTQVDGTVSQGVQQPYEIFIMDGIEDRYEIKLELSVYPNPAGQNIKLISVRNTTCNLTYQLYDMNGNLLDNNKISGTETSIPMNMLTPSTYFLKVTDNNREVKTFKIIKN